MRANRFAFFFLLLTLPLFFASNLYNSDVAEIYPLHIFSSGNLMGYLDPCG